MKRLTEYLIKGLSHLFRSEAGNVESSLVMIPLIALFLATLQLIVTVNYRNLDMTTTQNAASFQAFQQDVYPGDQLIQLDSHDRFEELKLLVVKVERDVPQIFPGISQLLRGRKIRSTGVAVYEESERCYGNIRLC